jgi:tRNA threonylcarbamoyladenosine biosynthesis protein TsaE
VSIYSEEELKSLSCEIAQKLSPRDWLFLEGPMGAGKSTFARYLLEALGVIQVSEGSPTFALAHEYAGKKGGIVHLDFYRLRSEAEIHEAGIEAIFWERESLMISEWVSLFPEFLESLKHGADQKRKLWLLEIDFVPDQDQSRRVKFTPLEE